MRALLVPHWLVGLSLWTAPDRSWTKAAQMIRKHALHRASAFVRGAAALRTTLRIVRRALMAGCRLNKRKKVPSTFQLLLAVTEEK